MKHIAAIMTDDEGVDAQILLAGTVETARALGMRTVGVIAEHHSLPDRSCAAGKLRDIASGKVHTIYLPTPPSGTACHLDAVGVEAACAALIAQLDEADLVILSKFGKLEAGGSGLRRAFEAAAEAGKPILTSVSGRHREAFRALAPEAIGFAGEEADIARWLRSLRPATT